MKVGITPFEFVPGTIVCVHLSDQSNFKGGFIEQQIAELARQQNKTIVISKPASWETIKKPSSESTSVDWLSRSAGISRDESKRIIAGLGEKLSERIAEKLAWNAGTPRCLLGFAAALISNPEIVVYSTVALDPEGIHCVHKFVASRCRHLSAIHISYPNVHGDGSPHPRNCPSGARCIEVTEG